MVRQSYCVSAPERCSAYYVLTNCAIGAFMERPLNETLLSEGKPATKPIADVCNYY